MTRRYIVPAESEKLWEIVFDCVEADISDRQLISSFREFVSPPPTLTSFTRIADNFIKAAESLSTIISLSSYKQEYAKRLDDWVKLCRGIVFHSDEIELRIQGFITHEKTGAPPFIGYYETHCLGVALWCSASKESLLPNYRILQAILCHAVNETKLRAAKEQLNLDLQLSSGCLTVRKLASPTNSDLLELLPENPCSISEYQKRLETLASDSKEIFYPLHHLVEIALKRTNVATRQSGQRAKTDRHREYVTETYIIDDDLTWPKSTIQKTTYITGNSKDKVLRGSALLSNDEFTETREEICIEVAGKDPSGGRSPGQQHFKAKEARKHIAMSNQQLPFAMDQLAPHDIDLFLKEITSLANTPGEFYGIDNEEVAAFLTISFWTSRSFENIAKATYAPSVSSAHANIALYNDDRDEWYFVITPITPDLKTRVERKTESKALPLAKRFCLPMPEPAVKTIWPWLANITLRYSEKTIFHHEVVTYENAADLFFKQIRDNHDCRLTSSRTFNHFHSYLSRQTESDTTLAMAISGKSDSLGKVHLHYTAHLIATIHNAYQRAVRNICGQHSNDSPKNRPGDERVTFIHVGSRFVPKQTEIVKLIESMQGRLAELRAEMHTSYDKLVNFHNVFTSYTVLMVGFCTGYRAVHDPLLQAAEIDHTSGFAVISDKDNADFYNARIVWLPPKCLDQLNQYSDHLNNLRRSLFWWNQKLFFSTKEDNVTGRQQERSCPGLFFLNQNHDGVEVRPGSLESYFALIGYSLPVNANRHYLRTNLLRLGCPLEVTNAFMGHWELGQEPWGRFSGLSPHTYRRELSNYLEILIEQDGWRVEPGC